MKGSIGRYQVVQVVNKFKRSKENLIQMLLELQEMSDQSYISKECAEIVADELNIPLSNVYDVLTFYAMFETEPRGRHIIEICKSAPCHVNNYQKFVGVFERELGIKPGETSKDGLFSLKLTSCFGVCDIAPAFKIGEKIYGNLNEEKIKNILSSYRGE